MLALALTLALAPSAAQQESTRAEPQVASRVSLRALLAAAPATPQGDVLVDVLLDGIGRARQLVVRDAEGRESLREWGALAGVEGAWRIDAPLLQGAVGPRLLEVEPAATDRAEYRALFAQASPEELAGVVQCVVHERGPDGREFALLRVQVEQGDLVRVALGPTGWHARGGWLPVVGESVTVRALATRDERGLLWVASGLRIGGGGERRVRGDDGAPRWSDLAEGPYTRSAAGLLGRRVLAGGESAGHVADLLLERGTGAPPTTFMVERGAGGGPSIPLAWERASIAEDGSLEAVVDDQEAASGAVHLQTTGSSGAIPTRDGPLRRRPEAACCLRPNRSGRGTL